MNACVIAGGVWPTSMVQRDQPVRHQLAELEPGHGRRERADAERVEEIGDGAEQPCASGLGTTRLAIADADQDDGEKQDRQRSGTNSAISMAAPPKPRTIGPS